MPLICIKSLPFESQDEMPSRIKAITEDIATASEISIEHVTVTWEYIPPRHYSVAGLMPATQPQSGSHPVLVELSLPSLYEQAVVETIMETIAFSIAKHTGVAYGNIFINCRRVQSGQIFDQGEVKRWNRSG